MYDELHSSSSMLAGGQYSICCRPQIFQAQTEQFSFSVILILAPIPERNDKSRISNTRGYISIKAPTIIDPNHPEISSYSQQQKTPARQPVPSASPVPSKRRKKNQ
jgi:hypothetical protein